MSTDLRHGETSHDDTISSYFGNSSKLPARQTAPVIRLDNELDTRKAALPPK